MKEHYDALDGLRGVAALWALAFHVTVPFNVSWLVPRSYLAVDFFFMLSGFVIAEAYEKRLEGGLDFSTFFRIRAARLWPMIAVGTAIGLFVALVKWKTSGSPPLWAITVAFPTGLLLIPTILPCGHRGAFPLNGPAWSLIYEGIF